MSIGYKSDPLIVEGSINADRYIQNVDQLGLIDVVDQKHRPFSWIFQQDGALSHTSRVATDSLEETVDVITDWPANSPDLWPIEVLWAILKKLVRRMNLQTLQEQKSVLLSTWNLIPQDTIDKLLRAFR
jgi:hypothetical protein